MGTVWLARDELLGRQVAVKQVLPPMNADTREAERQKERALREGRIAARLSTPHAISVYDVAVESDQPWLVMEYLPSRSLAEVLTEDGLQVLTVDPGWPTVTYGGRRRPDILRPYLDSAGAATPAKSQQGLRS